MKRSRAQIVITVGPGSDGLKTLEAMVQAGADVVRLNFSWANLDDHGAQIDLVRKIEKRERIHIPIIADMPGPRIQGEAGHTYDKDKRSAITKQDEEYIRFAVKRGVDYIAVSFVGSAKDIEKCREIVDEVGGSQRVIAKIERRVALDHLDAIIAATDAVMVARGDMGNEVPLEEIPFVQERIIKACKAAKKPVITATEMMLSMVNSPKPERAEVTDVSTAIVEGSDAVMLSDETARGKYPIETVTMMEKTLLAAERHLGDKEKVNLL
ncbi:MAG: hypothetical protein KGJ35_01355 [Patescibacteria group bacterium]|nr:hypothetical protein [Patescibacteria group bacterium]